MYSNGERVYGTYLYPSRLFGDIDYTKPELAIKVIIQTHIDSHKILITRNGGIFIKVPDNTKDYQEEDKLKEVVSDIVNRIICEFALNGVISAPATTTHVSAGYLYDESILVLAGGGGPEFYMERTTFPFMKLMQGFWVSDTRIEIDIVNTVIKQDCTSVLVSISNNLPILIAGAYSLFSQAQYGEALIDSWIVVEQIIDYLWDGYLKGLSDKPRLERLSDTRTYSASVRIEFLHSLGTLSTPLYESLHKARVNRNKLAHRASISLNMSRESMDAMRQMIELICQKSVYPAIPVSGIYYLLKG